MSRRDPEPPRTCTWPSGCAQEIPRDAELCTYHGKVAARLLQTTEEAYKVEQRRWRHRRST